ncbi:protein FAM234B-like [Pomacea canaliculata]|nr:protein FAM234B-like [Pomacea canaliculata]
MSKKVVQYAPLPQTVPSDDEDDIHQSQELGKSSAGRGSDTVEMRNISSSQSDQAVRYAMGKGRKRCMILTIVVVCVVVAGMAGAVAFHILSSSFNAGRVHSINFSPYGDWMIFYNDSTSKSSPVLIDVDGDKQEDVLVGVTSQEQFRRIQPLLVDHTMNESCRKLGLEYPCTSWLVALRGYDMKELWRTWLRSDLLFINCQDVDVNGDGKLDCILTGHEASIQAIDLATGKILWVTDAEDAMWAGHLVPSMSVFRASGIPDVDGDGVVDLIISHGGDPREDSKNYDQKAGRIIFLSGATGRPLGKYMELPQEKETFLSPQAYRTADGSLYFFLGSGGETTAGDFMVISYPDLHHNIMGSNTTLSVPGTNGSRYDWLLGIPKGANSLHILFSGKKKGVVVPPVLADVTGDGVEDVLMSALEGNLILFDGQSLQPVWNKKFQNMENFGVPAPGFFNDDSVLDFMVEWRQGSGSKQNYSVVYIVDGKDGSVLWSTVGRHLQMALPLSLRRKQHGDLFLISVLGRQRSGVSSIATSAPPLQASISPERQKRHLTSSPMDENETLDASEESAVEMCNRLQKIFDENHLTCDDDLSSMKMEMYLITRLSADTPVIVYTLRPEQNTYIYSAKSSQHLCHPPAPNDQRKVEICTVMIPQSSRGAVGDVDEDGHVDLIQLDILEADQIDDHYNIKGIKSSVVLRRISLATALNTASYMSEHMHVSPASQDLQEVLPLTLQPWRQFMGSSGNGTYRKD